MRRTTIQYDVICDDFLKLEYPSFFLFITHSRYLYSLNFTKYCFIFVIFFHVFCYLFNNETRALSLSGKRI